MQLVWMVITHKPIFNLFLHQMWHKHVCMRPQRWVKIFLFFFCMKIFIYANIHDGNVSLANEMRTTFYLLRLRIKRQRVEKSESWATARYRRKRKDNHRLIIDTSCYWKPKKVRNFYVLFGLSLFIKSSLAFVSDKCCVYGGTVLITTFQCINSSHASTISFVLYERDCEWALTVQMFSC